MNTWRIETWSFWLGVYSHLLKKDLDKYELCGKETESNDLIENY